MTIPLIYKRIWNCFGALFFASIVFILGYKMISGGSQKLTYLDTFTGTVTNEGVTENESSVSGKGSMKRNVFAFKIRGLHQTFGLYNPSQDYTEIDNKINVGDNVTVFYERSKDSIKPNLSLYQLEKNGEVIQSIDKYVKKETGLGYFVFTMGFVFVGLGIRQDRKYRNNNEK